MQDPELRPVERIDAPRLVAAIDRLGGPSLEPVRPLAGGSVGAWVVRRANGGLSVLTWAPPLPPGVDEGGFETARSLMELARSAGVPAPRDEDVIALSNGGIAVLQEYLPGVPVSEVSVNLIDHVVELAEMRRGLLHGTPFAGIPCRLSLRSSGPGFCHHEPLRRHSAATRELLARIEGIGAELGDRLERQIADDTDDRAFRMAWAHVSLRLIDWTVRHQPEMVDHWVHLARRHL